MTKTIEKLGFIKLGLGLFAFMATTWVSVSHAAYTVPNKYKGNCPSGYYSVVTDPADVSTNYTGAVKEFPLPANVCVRRDPDNNRNMNENFATYDFAVINGSAVKLYKPFASGIFENWSSFEPILGHFNTDYDYTDSNNPRHPNYKNYAGAHPVFISKYANAAIKYVGGTYIIDKQTVVRSGTGRCPSGYSTVGDSYTCYSKTNALKINDYKKVELIELDSFTKYQSTQECPLGYAMVNGLGSVRGICTEMRAIDEGISTFGISAAPSSAKCTGGEFTKDGKTCLPEFTAVYCDMSSAAQANFKSYRYNTGRHVYFWPTRMVNKTNALVDFNSKYSSTTTGTVAISDIKKSLNLFSNDDGHITLSAIDSGNFPVFHLHTYMTCDKLWDNGGWSAEPYPASW
jgi:hypothetical protein